jgi:hypothetical protein
MSISFQPDSVQRARLHGGVVTPLIELSYSPEIYVQDSLMILEVHRRISQGEYHHLRNAISEFDIHTAQTVQRTLESQRRRDTQIYVRIALTRPDQPTLNPVTFRTFLDVWRKGPFEEESQSGEKHRMDAHDSQTHVTPVLAEQSTISVQRPFTSPSPQPSDFNTEVLFQTVESSPMKLSQNLLPYLTVDDSEQLQRQSIEPGSRSKRARLEKKVVDSDDDFDSSADSEAVSDHSEGTLSLSRYTSIRKTAETPNSSMGNSQSQSLVPRPPKKGKQAAEKFRRRKASLASKSKELAELCDADVYLLIRRNRKFYVYSSTEELSWPPSADELVGSYHLEYTPWILTLL